MTFLEWLAQVNQMECDLVTAQAIYKVLKYHGELRTAWTQERRLNNFLQGAKLNGSQRLAMQPLWQNYKAVRPMLERLAPAKTVNFATMESRMSGKMTAFAANYGVSSTRLNEVVKKGIA